MAVMLSCVSLLLLSLCDFDTWHCFSQYNCNWLAFIASHSFDVFSELSLIGISEFSLYDFDIYRCPSLPSGCVARFSE